MEDYTYIAEMRFADIRRSRKSWKCSRNRPEGLFLGNGNGDDIFYIIYKWKITDIVTERNFGIISNNFDVDKICKTIKVIPQN
jgi:hypothetical protein